MELSIRAVDAECQIFKKNLKFKFQTANSSNFRIKFGRNIVFSCINYFINKNSYITHVFTKRSHFLCFNVFVKNEYHDLRYSGRLYIRGTRNQMYLV